MVTKIKKILVTGHQGFIGSNLVPVLKQDYEVFGMDRENGGDIFSDKLEEMIKKVDCVVHLAALTSVNQSFENPSATYRTNILGTARVAQLCLDHGVRLIYPSSAAIHHPDLSPYAASKYIAELSLKLVQDYIPATILRFYNVFGPGMNPNSGSIMYNFLTNDRIVIFGDGEQTRDYIHIRDIVDVIKTSIDEQWGSVIMDVGTGQAYSANYVAGLFAHHRGKKLEYEAPRREIKWSIADTQMLKRFYKKKLTTNLDVDIKELCQQSQ
jgi:nucleoside-diphosphate-sugar epimerase